MANIPGATNVLPGVFTDVVTDSRGVAVAGGLRVPAILGEGLTSQTIVSYAIGNGKDGVNPSYSSSSGADGRHFLLRTFPVISNRTSLFRNGLPLVGVEQKINSNSFSNKFDYRIDPETGRIELQKSYIKDLGGQDYSPFSTNKGDGYLSGPSDGYVTSPIQLVDANAPRETWNIRCIDVERDNSGHPKPNTAKFIAVGTISGNKKDDNGNSVVWKSNGESFSNGIIKFSINQGTGTLLSPGDGFTVVVESGRLNPNDSLTATYIPKAFLNSPVLLQGLGDVVTRYGAPSLDNTLSLGAQLAFANQASSIVALQCAPPLPRRTSVTLAESVERESPYESDFIFPLPVGVVPEIDSKISFFIVNNEDGTEEVKNPEKVPFYTVTDFANFIEEDFKYSVIKNYGGEGTIISGFDGYIARDTVDADGKKGIFNVPNFSFTSDYVGKSLNIKDGLNVANNATYLIESVSNGKAYVSVDTSSYESPSVGTIFTETSFQGVDNVYNLPLPGNVYSGSDATSSKELIKGVYDVTVIDAHTIELKKCVVIESGLTYSALDPLLETQYVIVTRNVVPNGYGLRVTLVDQKDADFYDAGWVNALESLEKTNVDIVVPLPKETISIIAQNALAHCITMSNIRNRKERVLFTGAIAGLAPSNLVGNLSDGTVSLVAVEDIGILEGIQGDSIFEITEGNVEDITNYSVSDAFGKTYRCVYFYPDQIVVQAGSSNILVAGFHIAAAAAGYMSSQPRVEIPLTNKVLTGFSILSDKIYSQLTLESLASSGVCILQPVSGGGRVLWGITTSQSGFAEEQEISIIFIRDKIAKTMRSSFAGYIGDAETPNTKLILANQAVNVINSLINQSLITAYKDLSVVRDSVDPRQWNVSVKVQPTYPVNWIYIRVGVGTI